MSEPQTFGQKAVGLSFNPSARTDVEEVKKACADLIDYMNRLATNTDSGEQARLCRVAITELQSAQMWAVKALTWTD